MKHFLIPSSSQLLRILMASQALSLIVLFYLAMPVEGWDPLELAKKKLKEDPNAAKKHRWVDSTLTAYEMMEQMKKGSQEIIARSPHHLKTPLKSETQQTIQEMKAPIRPAMPAEAISLDTNDTASYWFMLFGTFAIASTMLLLCYSLRSASQPKIEKPLPESRNLFSWLKEKKAEPDQPEQDQAAAMALILN